MTEQPAKFFKWDKVRDGNKIGGFMLRILLSKVFPKMYSPKLKKIFKAWRSPMHQFPGLWYGFCWPLWLPDDWRYPSVWGRLVFEIQYTHFSVPFISFTWNNGIIMLTISLKSGLWTISPLVILACKRKMELILRTNRPPNYITNILTHSRRTLLLYMSIWAHSNSSSRYFPSWCEWHIVWLWLQVRTRNYA